MDAQISKWGNSLALRIPKAMASDAGIEEGGQVNISLDQGRLVITPLKKSYSLQELVKDITPQNLHQETSLDDPMGAEVW